MPLISFTPKGNKEDETKHTEFVERMVARGYTHKQVHQLTDWYEHNKPS